MLSPTASGDDRLRMLLDAAGFRSTPSRLRVARRLQVERRPMSAEDMRLAEPSLTSSSIYRTLAELARAGAAHRIAGADGIARFELSEAVSGEHHHHLSCTNCGTMEVLLLPAEVEEGLARAADELQRSGRFAADSHRIELTGHCAACTASRNRQEQPSQ
jgi:Fur family transcriptional regulator, ferric uptake regulator